jgi:hypothetical protein
MAPARPLHELLAGLSGDAARASGDREAYLADNGHPDLPPDLVAEAVVSYADTAPVEVAEHLAPFVTTHSPVPTDQPPADDWFDLLSEAPTGPPPPDLDPDLSAAGPDPDASLPEDPGPAFDFGTGALDPRTDPSTMDDSTEEPPPTTEPQPADDATAPTTPAWPDFEPDPVDLDTAPDDPSDPDPLD